MATSPTNSQSFIKTSTDNVDDLNDARLIEMGVEDDSDRQTLLAVINELKTYKKKTQLKFKVFQDPLYGPIELHPLLVEMIDTPQFQRLRDIKQLGGVYYVYPGASHNRFEHSIGVCYLAGVFVESIRDKQPELNITERDVLCVKIAGLCHDMGHGPFSHLFQDHFMPHFEKKEHFELRWKHENTSIALLDHLINVNNLHSELAKYKLDWDRDRQFIWDLITGKRSEESEEKSFLFQIVANDISGVDVDKMDYIARDGQALGVKLNFDWNRYILFCRVINVKGECHICPREKEAISVYGLFNDRNYLHRVAYQHKTKRAVEFMINDALVKANDYIMIPGENNKKIKLSEAINDMFAFTKLTDSILQQIKCSFSEDLEESRQILESVDKRQVYSFVGLCLSKPSKPNSPPPSCSTPPRYNRQESEPNDEEVFKSPPPPIGTVTENNTISFTLRPTEEGLATSIVDLAIKIYPDLDKVELMDALVVDCVTFNYGQGTHNPIDNVYFYRKQTPNKAVPVKGHQRSHMFPRNFEEAECRIYSKIKDEKILLALRKGFVSYCKEENHCFETPLGEEEPILMESDSIL